MAISRIILLVVFCLCAREALAQNNGSTRPEPISVPRGPVNVCDEVLRNIRYLTYKLEKLTNQVHRIPFDLLESRRNFGQWHKEEPILAVP